jgi:carbonic anhydrase
MKITGPVVEMLSRNKLFAQKYQSPPPLLDMIKGMRASGAGVIVLSCSDPRLNPYQILGIDPTLSKNPIAKIHHRMSELIQNRGDYGSKCRR